MIMLHTLSVRAGENKQSLLSSGCIVLYCILFYVCAYVASLVCDVLLHMWKGHPQTRLQIVCSNTLSQAVTFGRVGSLLTELQKVETLKLCHGRNLGQTYCLLELTE
jgi:hypothetical protein